MTEIININVVREIENSIEVVEELEEIKENSSESIQNNAYSIDNSEDFPEIDDSIIENNDEIIEYLNDNPINLDDPFSKDINEEDHKINDSYNLNDEILEKKNLI